MSEVPKSLEQFMRLAVLKAALEIAAKRVENLGGNLAYRQAFNKAARIIRGIGDEINPSEL